MATWVEKVHRLMEERRWNAETLAREAGFERGQALRNAMNQHSNIGVSRGLQLARALGVQMEWLFDDDDDGPPRLLVVQDGGSLDSVRLLRDVLDAGLNALDGDGAGRPGSPEAAAQKPFARAGQRRTRGTAKPKRGRGGKRA